MQQTVHVQKIPDEPILIVINRGILSPTTYDFRRTCAAIAEALETHIMPFAYLISDDRELTIPDFDSLAEVLVNAIQTVHGPGSPSDPRIRGGAIVSSHAGLKIWSELLAEKELHNLLMPVFDDVDDALAYVYNLVAQRGAAAEKPPVTSAAKP
ncbi:MAG TPA: hypothetical protein VHO69_19420 [Phototrophicaceae bacterium]|nr:hypothetical protein [Phototrophicaceae bacterium]